MLQYENLQYKEESSIMSMTMTSQNKKRQLFINDWEIKKKWSACTCRFLKKTLIYTNTRIINIS